MEKKEFDVNFDALQSEIEDIIQPSERPKAPWPLTFESPQQILEQARNIFEDRNATYGQSYRTFGRLLEILLPDFTLEKPSDLTRLAMVFELAGKLERYCKNFNKGGHDDSLLDIVNYAAMLLSVDRELRASSLA